MDELQELKLENEKFDYEVKTIFGNFKLTVIKEHELVNITITGNIIHKSFNFERKGLSERLKQIYKWLDE